MALGLGLSRRLVILASPRASKDFDWREMMTVATHPQAAHGLSFSGMTDKGIGGGFDLQYHLADKSRQLYLCIGKEDNRVLVSGTTPKTRQADVLAAIDDLGHWAQPVKIWLVAEKAGADPLRTASVDYMAHVKPFYGDLTIADIAADAPAMVYAGNGFGRLLSPSINDRYYFVYGGRFETKDKFRGFDCTSFPMALLSIDSLPQPGYGKQLCDAAGATKCDLEQVHYKALSEKFRKDSIDRGIYILFSAGHVLLYNSDINMLYEFTHGGFKATPAAQRALDKAPQGLWWMRKLDDKYKPRFKVKSDD